MGIPRRIGSFRPFAEIAQGDATRVYKAHDAESGRVVVIKLLRGELNDDELAERFRAEATALLAVSHPNVVEFVDHGESDDGHFIVTAFVEGETLKSLIAGRIIPHAIGAFIVREAAAGLSAVHAAGILHRDFKPENIIVGAAGSVQLLDFGFAQRTSESLNVAGTVGYLAPELLTGGDATVRSDLYSVGTTLAEVVTGLSPSRTQPGPNVLERWTAAGEDYLAAAAVDDALASCVRALTGRMPSDRPADVDAVVSLLDAALAEYRPTVDQRMLASWLADERITHPKRMVATPAATPKTSRPRPHRVWGAAGLAVAVLGALWLVRPETPATPAIPETLSASTTPTDPITQGVIDPAVRDDTTSDEPTINRRVANTFAGSDSSSVASSVSSIESGDTDSTLAEAAFVRVSVLPWARVFVDGTDFGVTPLAVPVETTGGEHVIRLENPEFPTHQTTITAISGDTAMMRFSLWSTVARLDLNVAPWAEVLVDGVVRDTVPPMDAPLVLHPGEARLTLRHPDLGSFETTLDLKADSTYRLSYNLFKLAER